MTGYIWRPTTDLPPPHLPILAETLVWVSATQSACVPDGFFFPLFDFPFSFCLFVLATTTYSERMICYDRSHPPYVYADDSTR